MKKQMIFLAALLIAAAAKAQVSVDMGKMFTVPEKNIELNEPNKAIDGIVFIGDTRPAEKIEEGKYKGMRVNKSRRHFTIDGKVVQFGNSLSFRRAPQGIKKDRVVDVTLVPRSCMVQVKPTAAGKFTFCATTNKPEGNNLYVAVRNGATFKNIATLKYEKSEKTGKKDDPFETQSCDYQYADGDEVWIYSDGGINLWGFNFSGSIDKAFAGSDPIEVSKAVRRANKNK